MIDPKCVPNVRRGITLSALHRSADTDGQRPLTSNDGSLGKQHGRPGFNYIKIPRPEMKNHLVHDRSLPATQGAPSDDISTGAPARIRAGGGVGKRSRFMYTLSTARGTLNSHHYITEYKKTITMGFAQVGFVPRSSRDYYALILHFGLVWSKLFGVFFL